MFISAPEDDHRTNSNKPKPTHIKEVQGIASARLGVHRTAMMAQWRGLARVAALRGDHRRAARLLGAADALRTSLRYTQWTVTRPVQAGARAADEAGCDPDLLERDMAAGRVLPWEEVPALAPV